MGLLTPDPGLLFWMVVVFGIVFFLLAKYGFPVIIKMVDDRKAYIDNSLKAAREANAQLANVKAESEKILAQAHEEQARMTEKESAIRDIRRQVALLSVGVAEKVIRTKLADAKEQTELISRLVDEMVESSK